MNCEYCDTPGVARAGKKDGLDREVYVCDGCWKLLKDPKTALPLLRGHLTMQLKGKMVPDRLDKILNSYMGMISDWKPRN